MAKDNCIIYLEIHNTKDGLKTFKAGTNYDLYILKKTKNNGLTEFVDYDKKNQLINLLEWDFLPNGNLDLIKKLLSKENHVKVYSGSVYHTRRSCVSSKQDDKYKYPLVHSTPKTGTKYMYSSRNDLGFFGVPKIIFGDSGINEVIIDYKGEYGITEHAIGIFINNLEEGNKMKQALESKKFKKLLESLKWSNFQIDWRIFTYLKKDFWKEFN